MRTDSLLAVAAALEGKTRTRAELSAITDLSYPTVLRALEALQAEEVPETWPREYTIKPNAIAGAQDRSRQPVIKASSKSGPFGTLDLKQQEYENVPEAWERVGPVLSRGIQGIRFENDADLAKQYKNLVSLASLTASFALAIQPHLNDPLWLEAIGGKTEPAHGKLSKNKLHLVEDDGLDTEDA
jgi:hypothetical protein